MYSDWLIIYIIFGIIFVWLLVISYLILSEKKIKDQLFPKDVVDNKKEAYDSLLAKLNDVKGGVEEIYRKDEIMSKHLREIAKDGLHHLQKVHLERYNPYADTGGDQSFSVAFLSGNLDGLLITSLHSRSGTRIYAKSIKGGKSDVELSKEENEVLKKAIGD